MVGRALDPLLQSNEPESDKAWLLRERRGKPDGRNGFRYDNIHTAVPGSWNPGLYVLTLLSSKYQSPFFQNPFRL